MTVPYRDRSSGAATAAVAVGNLVPLAGVLWWGWRPYELVALYWLEVGIVGALAVVRVLLSGIGPDRGSRTGPDDPSPLAEASVRETVGAAGALAVCLLLFWAVHGLVVTGLSDLFGREAVPVWAVASTVAVGAASLAASHLLDLIVDYGRHRRGRSADLIQGVRDAVDRFLVGHVAVLVGAWAVVAAGTPLSLLLALVFVKTGVDVGGRLLADGGAEGAESGGEGAPRDERGGGAGERDGDRTEPGPAADPSE